MAAVFLITFLVLVQIVLYVKKRNHLKLFSFKNLRLKMILCKITLFHTESSFINMWS